MELEGGRQVVEGHARLLDPPERQKKPKLSEQRGGLLRLVPERFFIEAQRFERLDRKSVV